MTPPPTSLPTPMTVMVCHVKTWNEFYELIDTLDVRMWRNFWISMFRFIFRAFWIENAQIDFFDFGTFLKSSRHWNSGVDTWHTAGTCRYLQIGDMVLDFINDEYLNHTVIDFSVSRITLTLMTLVLTWRMICGVVPSTLTGARLDTQYWMFGSLIVNVSKEIYRELLSQLYCNVFYYIVMYRNVL